MTFRGGSWSGSADPCLWLMDPDPDPRSRSWIRILLFSSLTFKMPAKNKFFNTIFSVYYFVKLHLHHFSKIKSLKETHNSRNQGFSDYFCMMIEGSGSRAGNRSGSIPLTSGSGSGRPKNRWIRWVRIRNTVVNQDPDPGWTTRIILPRAKKHFFLLKYLNSLLRIRDPELKKIGSGMEKIWIRDPV